MKPLFNNDELATEIAVSGKMLLVNGWDATNVCTVLHCAALNPRFNSHSAIAVYLFFAVVSVHHLWSVCVGTSEDRMTVESDHQ